MRIIDLSSDVCSSDLFYQTFDSHFCELGDFETVGIDASARFPHDLVRLVDVGDTEFVSEAELVRHQSEDLSSKSVKGIDVNISLVDPMQDAADAFTHFAGGASTERDCKQTVRRRALFEHVEISSGKDTSLPGSGRGDYQCRFLRSLEIGRAHV